MTSSETVQSAKILPVFWSGDMSAWSILLGVSRKSSNIKPIGGTLRPSEGHLKGALREFNEETGVFPWVPLEYLGLIQEVTKEPSGLKVGTTMMVHWYLLRTDEVFVSKMSPQDDLSGFKAAGIDQVSTTLSHASTRSVYKEHLHPKLRKWFVE